MGKLSILHVLIIGFAFILVLIFVIPPAPHLVTSYDPNISTEISNFTINTNYEISGDFQVGREVTIRCFLQLDNIPLAYNWTEFRVEMIDGNNESLGGVGGSIWKNESFTDPDYSISSIKYSEGSDNRNLFITLKLPDVDLIQFEIELDFFKSEFIPGFQDKWIFHFISERYVVQPRSLLEQIFYDAGNLISSGYDIWRFYNFIKTFGPIFLTGGIIIFGYMRKRP